MYGSAACSRLVDERAIATTELRYALQEQAEQLEGVLARYREALLLLPTETSSDWRGYTQLVYEWALGRLRVDLDEAHEHLMMATRETRRAIESLGDRVE